MDMFVKKLRKFLTDDVEYQFNIDKEVFTESLKLDFVMECQGYKLGLQSCEDLYDSMIKSHWFDAMIIGEAMCDCIWRIDLQNMATRPYTVIEEIADAYPQFFKHLKKLKALSLQEEDKRIIEYQYYLNLIDSEVLNFVPTCVEPYYGASKTRSKRLYDFAQKSGLDELDLIQEKYLESLRQGALI